MEEYYYLEDIDGGLVVDLYYMDNYFDPELQRIIMQGTLKEIDAFINFPRNTDII